MVTQRQEQRRSKRYRQQLLVEMHEKHGARELYAIDVARHGMFIKTDDPPRARHLVQLTVHLPTGPISAAVTVSRAITEPKGGTDRGVGVQFFALSAEAKSRWDEFIQALADNETHKGKQPVVGLPGQAAPRAQLPDTATFLVKLKSIERLKAFTAEHVMAGGTVLFTPVLREPGDPVHLVVVHPITDEEFSVPGIVAAVHKGRPKRLEIHFSMRSSESLAAFEKFVATGKPPAVQPAPEPPAAALAERLLARDALPWEPKAMNAPGGGMATLDLDFDVDVFAENSIDEEDPIDWAMAGIEVDFSMDEQSMPGTVPPAQAAAFWRPTVGAAAREAAITTVPQPSAPVAPEEEVTTAPVIEDSVEDVEIEVESSTVKAVMALDTGLRPQTYLFTCDTCDADPYPVDLGPCSGLLGLVADLAPRHCAACAKVVAVVRAVETDERKERRSRLLDHNWKAEQLQVPLTFALTVADLDDAAVCPECSGPVKDPKAVQALPDLLADLQEGRGRVKTKVRCGKCDKGYLLAASFKIG